MGVMGEMGGMGEKIKNWCGWEGRFGSGEREGRRWKGREIKNKKPKIKNKKSKIGGG